MSWPQLGPDDPPADVTLLLEGTFPMIRGGVSSWVNQVIRGLEDWRFAIVFLGATREQYSGICYERPENVVHLETHYLMDTAPQAGRPRPRRGQRKAFAVSDQLHRAFKQQDDVELQNSMARLTPMLEQRGGLSYRDFVYGRRAWEQIVDGYRDYCTDPSFIDYFWSVRSMHSPLFVLSEIAKNLPPTRLYHSSSTGYAGFLGSLAYNLHNRPFILTEHGIYTKEREIELSAGQSRTLGQDELSHGFINDVSYSQKLWTRFFKGLGRLTYAAADSIVTLYEGNRRRQIADGASPERTEVIPNGIEIEPYARLRETTATNDKPVIVLIGRVTPIKDIKTFIRAMRIVSSSIPEVEGWIAGPEDEDPHYVKECRDLVHQLDLGDTVRFLGFQSVPDLLSRVQLLALTSISEAQPLVALEAMAAGIPVVCTDVGSCREMVFGQGDTADGPADGRQAAGRLIPIADASAAGHAFEALLQNTDEWQQARENGIRRADEEHNESLMLDRYRKLYQRTLADEDVPGAERRVGA